MLDNCPAYYQTSRVYRSYLQAVGTEHDNFNNGINDILNAFFVKIAPDWSIPIWENELALTHGKSDPLELRRAKILAKLEAQPIMTPDRILQIINQFVVDEVARLSVNYAGYSFSATVPVDDIPWFEAMVELVNDIKPAHLEFIPTPAMTFVHSEEIYLPIITLQGRVSFWNDRLRWLDGYWLLDGSELLSDIRYGPHDLSMILQCSVQLDHQVGVPAIYLQIGIPVQHQVDVSGILQASVPEANQQDLDMNVLQYHSDPHDLAAYSITTFDPWFLDGTYALDGTKLIDAIYLVEDL